MSHGAVNARVLVVGLGSRADARDQKLLNDIQERLKEHGVTVITASDEELVEIATNAARGSRDDTLSVPRAEKLMRMFVKSPGWETLPALEKICCAQAGVIESDRPAWVSPYGPARGRRK